MRENSIPSMLVSYPNMWVNGPCDAGESFFRNVKLLHRGFKGICSYYMGSVPHFPVRALAQT